MATVNMKRKEKQTERERKKNTLKVQGTTVQLYTDGEVSTMGIIHLTQETALQGHFPSDKNIEGKSECFMTAS